MGCKDVGFLRWGRYHWAFEGKTWGQAHRCRKRLSARRPRLPGGYWCGRSVPSSKPTDSVSTFAGVDLLRHKPKASISRRGSLTSWKSLDWVTFFSFNVGAKEPPGLGCLLCKSIWWLFPEPIKAARPYSWSAKALSQAATSILSARKDFLQHRPQWTSPGCSC